MPAPRPLARFYRRATNRVIGPLAARLPGFGRVVHRGRVTQREYRTPVNVFRHDGRYVIALTYGPDSHWVRNALAAGGCTLEVRGRTVRLIEPRLVHDERRRAVPAPIRVALGLLDVSDFLALRRDDRSRPG